MSTIPAAPAFASASEALALVCAGLRYLAAADPTAIPAQTQAECLLGLEQADAVSTAARARLLAGFTAAQGYCADADYSPASWLIHRTRVTKGTARRHLGWARRAAAHPQVVAALAEGHVLSESMALTICGWTGRLRPDCWDSADAILVAAARAGACQQDLAELAAEIYARSLPDPDDDGDGGFEDRKLRVETTFEGAGVITGDLTPECTAIVTAVLESLAAPAGSEDTRTRDQRYHDALEEAMRRLAASGLLPARAGQPVKAWVHMSLAELRAMDAGSVLQGQWIAAVRARWAAHRGGDSVGGGDGAAWLDGNAARAVACDAALSPVVTGDVDPAVLDDLVQLCVELHRIDQPGSSEDCQPPAGRAREMLQHAIIGKAIDLLSGPGGLASFLRRQQLGADLAGPSLPLDIGYADTVPAGIRNAVKLRDKHCQWTGGCDQPASACQVHHVRHKADGGPTSVRHCILLCWFHHQVVIHRWGWTLILHPDGTTTAWNKTKTKMLRSHSPPARAG